MYMKLKFQLASHRIPIGSTVRGRLDEFLEAIKQVCKRTILHRLRLVVARHEAVFNRVP